MSGRAPLRGATLAILTIALGLGTFIQILDTSIANVAVPSIAGDLGASPDQGTWVITAFAVSNAIVLPLTGWLARRFGEVRVFVVSILLFSLLSWLCGLAWTLPLLIFFRVLQGAAAGSLIPLSQSLLLQNYPSHRKGLALGLWSIVVITAPLVGPILGGWITDKVGWPWIFYINVPLGILSAMLTWEILSNRDNAPQKTPVDLIGFSLLIIGVGSLQIALDKGNDLDWFGSHLIILLAVLATVGLILFVCWNSYSSHPVVDFSFFHQRNFTIATSLSGLGFLLLFGSIIIQPLWLQVWQRYTAIWAGVTVAPFGIFPIILSPIIGRYIHLMDPRILVTLSLSILAFSYYLMSGFNTEVPLSHLIALRTLQGLGLSLFFIPLITLALSDIPNHQLSSASGVFNFVRLISGGGLGTALFVNYWTRWQDFHHAHLAENFTATSPTAQEALIKLSSAGLDPNQSYFLLNHIVDTQAATLAVNDLFWISSMISICLLPLPWLCHAIKGSDQPVAAID